MPAGCLRCPSDCGLYELPRQDDNPGAPLYACLRAPRPGGVERLGCGGRPSGSRTLPCGQWRHRPSAAATDGRRPGSRAAADGAADRSAARNARSDCSPHHHADAASTDRSDASAHHDAGRRSTRLGQADPRTIALDAPRAFLVNCLGCGPRRAARFRACPRKI